MTVGNKRTSAPIISRVVKIYTKTGDAGETSLFDNTRVSKADARVDAYGEVDELNACLGAARAAGVDEEIGGLVEQLQKDLFAVGARLADPSARIAPRVTKAAIAGAGERVVTESAYAACKRAARAHYENFPVASILLPRRMRPHVAAVYAFARAADDFADEGEMPASERLRLLDGWEQRLRDAA